jgi:hypothetical protein
MNMDELFEEISRINEKEPVSPAYGLGKLME